MEIKGISFNEYHKIYYNTKIKGFKKPCECGMMVDKFRFARHCKSKKHFSLMSIKNELEKIN